MKKKYFQCLSAALLLALAFAVLCAPAAAQYGQEQYPQSGRDQYQGRYSADPPTRVGRLAYLEGSVSMQPAGESDWVEAVPNRPLTIGDKLWADRDSRAEIQLGIAAIRMSSNTGFSFLNLDDRTTQIQLTSGAINFRVRRLDRDDVFEIDTPNQAFSVYQPGDYRIEASEDGNYTVVTVRDGEGESTGYGQTYTIHAGQRATFSGMQALNAEVEQIGPPDQFDNWAYARERRYHDSRSSRYLSPYVVGYDDLDDYGDWRDDPSYGAVWFPNRVASGWAPYREGHWAWIDPWGWTWVDDEPWGYAPFHYGRWAFISGRWGWCPGPTTARAVYAPALVVFVGSFNGGYAGNVGWFPLAPREVYVPSYAVSQGYMQQVNVTNTTVNTTTITNVYNTTVVNRSTTITNVNYVNRNVQGAVSAVPQRVFVGAQPVARAVVPMSAQQVASAQVAARVPVAPTPVSVMGVKASTANHVTAPPPAVMNRSVIAKATPAPPPVPFAKQQQALAAHPGQPLPKQEEQSLRPPSAAAHPLVKQAPPGKPATPTTRAGSQPSPAKPGQPAEPTPAPAPSNRPPTAAQPNRPESAPPPSRPEVNRPSEQPSETRPPNRPEPNKPEAAPPPNRPEANRPAEPPAERPPSAQPNRPTAPPPSHPEANRPSEQPSETRPPNRPEPNKPETAPPPNRPEANRPAEPPARAEHPPAAQPNRPESAPPPNRPETNRPPAERPNDRPNRPEPNKGQTPPPKAAKPEKKQPTPEEKKRQEEKQQQEKPPGF